MSDSGNEWKAADCNIPGLVAGICLIALPFLGFWWSVRFGDGAFFLEVSPFELAMYGFGREFFSPLMAAVNLAIVISIVFFGALLLTGSLLRCSWQYRKQSDQLVGMASKKPLWLVLLFIISIGIAGLGIEYSLRESGITISMPVIAGDTVGTIMASGTTVQIPVSLSLNTPFWYAVVFAIIAAYAGIYQKRQYHDIPEEDPTSDAGESVRVEQI